MTEQHPKSSTTLLGQGIWTLIFATGISFFLATTADISHHELGALVNYIWPPTIGLLTIIIFLLIARMTKDKRIRVATMLVLAVYNLYVGFAFHIEKDYWPLVSF